MASSVVKHKSSGVYWYNIHVQKYKETSKLICEALLLVNILIL